MCKLISFLFYTFLLCLTSSHAQVQKHGDLSIQFLGNTNILLSDGETVILTDGFFSRPSSLKVAIGKLSPNLDRISEALSRANINSLNAVIPLHSHYDHAMDAPALVQLLGGLLIGSESSINIGKAQGLQPEQMSVVQDADEIVMGKFKIKFIKHPHWEYPSKFLRNRLLNNHIDAEFDMPSHCLAYKEGDSYTLMIEHVDEKVKMAFHGSVGYRTGALKEFHADILFLGVSGIAAMDNEFKTAFRTQVVEQLDPTLIIPFHWDNVAIPLNKGLKDYTFLQRIFLKVNTKKDIKYAQDTYAFADHKILDLWKIYKLTDLIN